MTDERKEEGHGDELIVVQEDEEDEEGIEYPVVKLECFFLSFADASATPLY